MIDEKLIGLIKQLYKSGNLMDFVADQIKKNPELVLGIVSQSYKRPNLNPSEGWKEIKSHMPFLRKWILKNSKLMVQASCEQYTNELWLRLSCSIGYRLLNDNEIKGIVKDFLGSQWVDPNERTFIFNKEDTTFNIPTCYILFCLSGIPEEDGFVMQMIKNEIV